jgi:hypothetical protein
MSRRRRRKIRKIKWRGGGNDNWEGGKGIGGLVEGGK